MTIVKNPNELSSLSSNLDKNINQIVLGNCLEILSSHAEQSVNLIVTSPPYGHWFSLIVVLKTLPDKGSTENTKLKKLFPS